MRRLVILGILIILISSLLIAGCVFEEEKEKKEEEEENGGNGNGNSSPVLNITEVSHEPASPKETDEVNVTAKIEADNDIVSVKIIFCDNDSGICTVNEDMAPGADGTYTYTLAAGTYSSGQNIKYQILVSDSEGNNDDAEKSFTVQ